MSNVYKLDGSTNIKMGTFCGKPALFIRPMFPKDPVNHSHEERHAWHTNDLAEDEQVILMAEGQDLGQLYMAMRQAPSWVKQLHRGEDMSVHIHTHPSSGEQAVDRKFSADSDRLPEEERVKEIFSFDNKHQHSTSVERNDFSEPERPIRRANIAMLASPSNEDMEKARKDANGNGTTVYEALHANALAHEESLTTNQDSNGNGE